MTLAASERRAGGNNINRKACVGGFDAASEFFDGERVGDVEDANLRIGEASNVEMASGGGLQAQPIGVGFERVCVVQRDRLHDADVVVSVKRG